MLNSITGEIQRIDKGGSEVAIGDMTVLTSDVKSDVPSAPTTLGSANVRGRDCKGYLTTGDGVRIEDWRTTFGGSEHSWFTEITDREGNRTLTLGVRLSDATDSDEAQFNMTSHKDGPLF